MAGTGSVGSSLTWLSEVVDADLRICLPLGEGK